MTDPHDSYQTRESRLHALREALIAAERSGPPTPFDFDDFIARKTRASKGTEEDFALKVTSKPDSTAPTSAATPIPPIGSPGPKPPTASGAASTTSVAPSNPRGLPETGIGESVTTTGRTSAAHSPARTRVP